MEWRPNDMQAYFDAVPYIPVLGCPGCCCFACPPPAPSPHYRFYSPCLVSPSSLLFPVRCSRAHCSSYRRLGRWGHRPHHPGQYAAFTAFIEPGDEVIIFEPFFDQYLPSVAFNGGKCVYVPLHPSAEPAPGVQIGKRSWTIDFDELE